MELQPASIQFVSPPSIKFHSPTKRDMARSEELLRRVLHPKLMKQEKIHAMSKRPQIRCAAEADIAIQKVLSSTQDVKANLVDLEQQFQNLEGKVDKLELEFENGQKHHMIHQLSFSPGIGVSPPPTPVPTNFGMRRTPSRQAKLKVLNMHNAKVSSLMMSPSSPGYMMSSPIMEYTRKRNVLEICLNRLLAKVKGEAEILQGLFEDNFKVLKFRRAENCVLNMIKLQRKLRGCKDNLCLLRDRLLYIQN